MERLYKVITTPTVEPVTLSEVKDHLRFDSGMVAHDSMVNGLITSARQWVERVCGRALVQQTRAVLYKDWPDNDRFVLPYPPIQSVSSVQYTNSAGTTSTFSSDNYSVITEREPGVLVLGYNKTWPTATLHHDEWPIEIQYVCGYATSGSPPNYRTNIPNAIKHAIKMHVEINYDALPEAKEKMYWERIHALLAPYRVWGY